MGLELDPDLLAKMCRNRPVNLSFAVCRAMHAGSDDNIIVVGGGISGLCAAVVLQQNGYRYTAIESAEAIAGMWPDNRYLAAGLTPGAICTRSDSPHSTGSDTSPPAKRCRGTYEEMQGYLEDVASDSTSPTSTLSATSDHWGR
jgi:NAD(P)-binding Rossmann-like domain